MWNMSWKDLIIIMMDKHNITKLYVMDRLTSLQLNKVILAICLILKLTLLHNLMTQKLELLGY